jgi:hypothetical protein
MSQQQQQQHSNKPKNQMLEKVIHFFQKEETLQKLHYYVMDPLLNHILERVFPYIVLTCVLFGVLIILAMGTFGIVLLQMKHSTVVLPVSSIASV